MPVASKEGAISNDQVSSADKAKAIPEDDEDEKFWKIVGWAPHFGDGNEGVDFSRNLSDQSTWVEERLQDAFFGGTTSFR